MKNILIILLGFICLSANAQDQPKRFDLLILKDGSEFKGKIIHYQPNEQVNFQTEHGQEIVFDLEQVEQVKMGQTDELLQHSSPEIYKFKEEKLYLNIEVLALLEDDGTGRAFQVGLIQQFSRGLGLGAGIGYYDYEKNTGRKVYPLYLTYRGYLLKRNLSPYFNMNTGYGFFFKNADYGISKARGGVMLNPQLGVRFGAGDSFCTLAVGAVYQRITAIFEGWGGNVVEERISLKRSQISLAINF